MNYCELEFSLNPLLPAREVLIAELAERGFESFVETEEGLKAYIPEKDFSDELLSGLATSNIQGLEMTHSKIIIEDRNWNEEWEKNFSPIIVDDLCLIRAPFHEGLSPLKYNIVIEPKMSFGTGHHETTHLVASEMMKFGFDGKRVLDMGCGTGILAILARMLGAKECDAIDIDEWSYENTLENVARNNMTNIRTILGGADAIPAPGNYDVILANINRNILVRDMEFYTNSLSIGGHIFFSGFYTYDKEEIDKRAGSLGLSLISEQSKNEWCVLKYTKTV